MDLNTILNVNLIEIDRDYKNKEEVIQGLSHLLFKQGCIVDQNQFIEAVYQREQIGMTGMGNHIAIPHGLSESVIKASVAIVKTKENIDWESLDGEPVQLIFMIAVPKNDADKTHIKILSRLASILAYESNVNGLMACSTSEEFLRVFNEYYEEYIKDRKEDL